MNAIKARSRLYFAHHVKVGIRLNPPPRSALEAAFILDCFRSLGQIEYFHIYKTSHNNSGWSPLVSIIFNPSLQQSQLGLALFRSKPTPSDCTLESSAALELRRNQLKERLNSIIALPRFSYIDGDTDYALGHSELKFKHRLLLEGVRFDGRYSVTRANKDNPFCCIEPVSAENPFNVDELRPFVRHNGQKFHRIHSLVYHDDPASIRTGSDQTINYEKLMILD